MKEGIYENTTESIGSPTLNVLKCYDPERESTLVPGEALDMIGAMQEEEDKEHLRIVAL